MGEFEMFSVFAVSLISCSFLKQGARSLDVLPSHSLCARHVWPTPGFISCAKVTKEMETANTYMKHSQVAGNDIEFLVKRVQRWPDNYENHIDGT